MTDTRTLYLHYRRRRRAINATLDAVAFLGAMAALYLAWVVFA
jgi:hypothetical protein